VTDRIVRIYIGPEDFRPDVSGFSYVEEYKGGEVLVGDVRSLSDTVGVLYVFRRADLFSAHVNSALLKIVEEGRCSFIFQSNSLVDCNAALLSRCQKIIIPNKIFIGSMESISSLYGLTPSETALVEAALGLRSVPYREVVKDSSVNFSKVFSALSQAYVNKDVFDTVSHEVWMRLKTFISQPFFRGNKYSYITLWRSVNYA